MPFTQLRATYQTLKKADLIEIILEQNRVIEENKQEREMIAAQLQEMKRILGIRNKKIFGSSSEKSPFSTKELKRDYIEYEELTKPINQPQAVSGGVVKEKRTYHAGHPGRYAIPENIRREETHIYPTGYDSSWNKEMSSEITERLSIKIEIINQVTIRHKIIQAGKIIIAPFPVDDPFYKYKATVELVATQMMLRFALHMPYYRFRQLLFGCPVGYPTLINWAARTFDLMDPLREVLHTEILSKAKLLCMDETTFKLMDTPLKIAAFKATLVESGLKALELIPTNEYVAQLKKETSSMGKQQEPGMEKEIDKGLMKGKMILRGQMWALVNPEAQLVLFDFSPSRATVNAVLMLKDYEGLLMADSYSGYVSLAKLMNINITLLSCWAHCRRKFLESQNPGNPDPVVKEIINRIGQLYQIEKKIKDYSPEKKMEVRKESQTILELLKIYLDTKLQLYAPKESVAVAIQYCLNHWAALTQYTQYDKGILDNNVTERAIRPLTINRKNSLFLGSVEHAAGAALMYSLMECCRMHKVDPYAWLLDVMKKVESYPKDQLVDLLPHKWKKIKTNEISPPIS